MTRVGKVDKAALRRMISETIAKEQASESSKVAQYTTAEVSSQVLGVRPCQQQQNAQGWSLRAIGKSKKEALRSTVLEVAATLFAQRGYGGTNLQDIADTLGISRPALIIISRAKKIFSLRWLTRLRFFRVIKRRKSAAKVDFNPSETLRQMVFNHAKWLLEHSVEFA